MPIANNNKKQDYQNRKRKSSPDHVTFPSVNNGGRRTSPTRNVADNIKCCLGNYSEITEFIIMFSATHICSPVKADVFFTK